MPRLYSFRRRLRHSSETLKRLLMISLGLGVFCAGLVTYNLQQQESLRTGEAVLGAQDEVMRTPETTPQPLNPEPNLEDPEITVELPDSETAPDTSNYTLSGPACTESVSDSTCELLVSGAPVTTLKSCAGTANPACNFYTYTLGRDTDNGVYIFQSYTDGTATLTDVLEYTTGTQGTVLVDTVLFEELANYRSAGTFDLDLGPSTLAPEVEANNQDYLTTLNDYR